MPHVIFMSHKGLLVDKDIRRMVEFMGHLLGELLVIEFLHLQVLLAKRIVGSDNSSAVFALPRPQL